MTERYGSSPPRPRDNKHKQKNNRREASVVGHVAWGSAELGVGLDDLVDCLQEVLLSGDLPAGSDGKHPCLCAHTTDLST